MVVISVQPESHENAAPHTEPGWSPGELQNATRATPRRGHDGAEAIRAHTGADAFRLSTNSNGRYRSGENVRMMDVNDFIV